MEFGKQPDIDKVDFTLPPDHPGTGKFLKSVGPSSAVELRLGYTAWTHKEWLGSLYPSGAKPTDFLHYYGQQFGTIELNTTFYRIPDQASVRRWRNAVPDTFRFCPKIFQDISHKHKLFGVKELTLEFARAVAGFGEKLGVCFLQLPPDFGVAQLPRLENFIHEWPSEIHLSVEFRHESWFDRSPLAEAGFDLLRNHRIGAVITDVAGRRDVLHMHLTHTQLLLRFVGNSLHKSDFLRTDQWAERLGTWFQKGLKEAYVFLHQPDCTTIPDFGGYVVNSVNRHVHTQLKPLTLYNIEPRQGSLF